MSMIRTVYSQKLKEALNDLRPAFRDVGQSLAHLTRKRAEIAPAFMRAYTLWCRETKRPFIAFVHALDPSMPVNDRKVYRTHPSYQAALYMQKLAAGQDTPARRGLTPLSMLAITIKSFLPLCGSQKDQKDALQVLLAATKWRDTDRNRLIGQIRRAKAVGLPKVPRLVEVSKATKAVLVAFEREKLSA